MRCVVCGKGIKERVTLYRVNKKGVRGIWACEEHLKQTDAKVDPITQSIVKIIEEGRDG